MTDEEVRALVDAAPPLSETQVQRLRAALTSEPEVVLDDTA